MGIADHGENASAVFADALKAYEQKKEDASYAIIQELVAEARIIAGGKHLSAERASVLAKAELNKYAPGFAPSRAQLDLASEKMQIPRQAFLILGLWDSYSLKNSDMKLRCLDTGLTEERLKKEDARKREKAEAERKQSEAWQAQGLCKYCGGEIGMFKKCKKCKMKN